MTEQDKPEAETEAPEPENAEPAPLTVFDHVFLRLAWAVAIVVPLFLIRYVVPAFEKTALELGLELPIPTRLMFGLSGRADLHLLALLAGVAWVAVAPLVLRRRGANLISAALVLLVCISVLIISVFLPMQQLQAALGK